MAKFWELDPDIVGRWSIVKFMDREEYAQIQTYLSKPRDESEPGSRPGFKPWKGPYAD